jgi:hypothetical protein
MSCDIFLNETSFVSFVTKDMEEHVMHLTFSSLFTDS